MAITYLIGAGSGRISASSDGKYYEEYPDGDAPMAGGSLNEPTNINVSGGTGSITVTWTDAANTTSTFIFFSATQGATVYYGFADAGTETYTISDVAAGTYYVALMSHNSTFDIYSTKTTEYSGVATAGGAIPAAPSSFTATATSSSTIDLAWTDNSTNELGFEIERSLDGSTGWTNVLNPLTDEEEATDTGLSASTEYFYRIRSTNGNGNSSYVNAASSATTSAAGGSATMIASQNFESTGWETEFTGESTWGSHLARTTSNPHSGTYSLRGNQLPSETDSITGLTGISNPVLDWRGAGNAIVNNSPDELFLRYWFRHDDYNHVLEDDGSGEGKLLFFVDNTYNTQAMFLNNQLAATGTLRLNYGNGGYSEAWANTNWGYSSLYLSNPSVNGGTDGTWRKLEYYINYSERYVQIWVDGLIMKSSKHGDAAYPKLTSDGKSYYDPALTLKTKGFQFWWVRAANIDSSTDGTGEVAGWQIDDLEAWDGLPA